MPPKVKKRKGKNGEKQKISTPIDDVDRTTLSRPKLEEFCVKVHNALVNERQHIESLRLERDKLINMVAIAQEHLAITKQENYGKQTELNDAEQHREFQAVSSNIKLLNLRREKNTDLINTKLESVKSVDFEQINHEKRSNEIKTDINELKSALLTVEKQFLETKTEQEIEHAELKNKLQERTTEMCNLIEQKWEKKLNIELNYLNDKFKKEYETFKNRKIRESSLLIKNNDRFVFDLNHYYKNVVQHNLNLIMTMKNNLRGMKTEIAVVENSLALLKTTNKELTESITESNKEMQILNEKLTHSSRDQTDLNKTIQDLKRKTDSLEALKLDLDILSLAEEKQKETANKITKEKEERLFMLKTMAEEIILVLEYMANHLRHKLDELDSMLSKLSSKVNLPPSLTFRPAKDHLTWELATVVDRHDETLHNYYHLLEKYDIHPDDTGFTPLLSEEILKKVDYLRILVNEEVFDKKSLEELECNSVSKMV